MAGTVRRGGQIAWAGLKLGVAVLRLRRRAPDRLPAYVSTTLVGLGTTFVKRGQGLSLRWDLLPAPYREALSRLHSDVPAFSADQAKRIVKHAFGAPVDEFFASFDDKPLAAGSVAQIHSARMHDGRDVVVSFAAAGLLSLRLVTAIARAPVNSRRLLALNVGPTTLKGAVLYPLWHEQLDVHTIMGGTDMKGPSTTAESPQLSPHLGRCHVNLNSIQSGRFQPEQQTSGMAGFPTGCYRTSDLSPH
jgi:hypothetical protein